MESVDKIERVLGLHTKLVNGAIINKAEEATNYNVNERSRIEEANVVQKSVELERIQTNDNIDHCSIVQSSLITSKNIKISEACADSISINRNYI